MKLIDVWSSYEAKQLSEKAGCSPNPMAPIGEDPIKTSIYSLTLPIIYTPLSSIKPQPGSSIQSQGIEAVYFILNIIDELAESIVGKDKWNLIYDEEQKKINSSIEAPDQKLPVLSPLSHVTNKELSASAVQFFHQVNSVTNTISRTQINLQQASPIDRGLELETEYQRFNIQLGTNISTDLHNREHTDANAGTDALNTFLRTAIQAVTNLPAYYIGSSEDPGCVLSIPDDLLVFNREQGTYKLTINDSTVLNSMLVPGDVVKLFGEYYVLSLSSRMHGLTEPIVEHSFVVKPSVIANSNSVYADASVRLERQIQLSRWKEEPLLKALDTYPIFSCFTQCASMWHASNNKQDFCVVTAFFKGCPHELNNFPLTATQIIKYLAFYDHRNAVLRFFISDGSCGAMSGLGIKTNTLTEKDRMLIKKPVGSITDLSTTSSLDTSTSDSTDTSTPSSLTSDYVLETDSGHCGREAGDFFSKYDIDDYMLLTDADSTSRNCFLNSSELLSILQSTQQSAEITSDNLTPSSQNIISNFHSALQAISCGISLMYEVPLFISKEYFVWVNTTGEHSVETLYLYDRSSTTSLRRPLLTLNLRKFLAPYLKKNNNKSEEHLNGINSMPIVQSVLAVGLPSNHILLIIVPCMSGSFFFCLFKRDKVPSSSDIYVVAHKTVIDVINADLLQTHGLLFVATRTFSSDSHAKIKSSTNMHIFSLIYNCTEANQSDTSAKNTSFRDVNFTILFKPIHTLFLTNAGTPTKGIVPLDSMCFSIYFESLSYFYIADFEFLYDQSKRDRTRNNDNDNDNNDNCTSVVPVTPVYTACRSISTLLYNRDGEHILLFEQGETQALIYSLTNLKEPKYSIVLPGGDRINHAATGGGNGLIAFSGDHVIGIYQLGAAEIYLKHYVTRGRAIGIAWSTPTNLLVTTEQALYTISISI